MAGVSRHPLARAIGQAGYYVTRAGGWVTVAGHGAIHHFHGWRAVPWGSAWRASLSVRAPGWAFALWTPLGDIAGQEARYGGGLEGCVALLTAAVAFEAPDLILVCDDARVVRRAMGALAEADSSLWPPSLRRRILVRRVSVVNRVLPGEDPAAVAVRALPPRSAPVFDPARVTGDGRRRVAHGTHDYVLDLGRGTCSCPAFRYGRRPCKHFRAALSGTA
ncbi:MAG: SWIM zinc finger family protein [Clostridia bacterium]